MRVRVLVLAATAVVAAVVPADTATSAPTWAPVDQASIHPGVQTVTQGGQCTANFVFTDATDIYLGQAAHCAGTGGSFDTNGCDAGTLPPGTKVEVEGASQPGVLVYSSWVEMQTNEESNPNTCQFNDFALVRLNAADRERVNPSVPFWGGPNAPSADSTLGEQVFTYGNSSLRLGIQALSPKTGISLGEDGGGWNHSVYTVSPGIPGDSGSAFLDSTGGALGLLVTLQVAPLPAGNGVTDIGMAQSYMEANTELDLTLAPGTESFSSGLTIERVLGLLLG